MHFEVLSEDLSGQKMLLHLLPKILGEDHTFHIHSYKGIGRLPKKMGANKNAASRILLDQLPKLLQGYGNAYAKNQANYPVAVLIVCDLDGNNYKKFMKDLNDVLENCNPAPLARFCVAIEEAEAWFLGDKTAVKQAFPKAKEAVLNSYVNDSICGTWERLADAVYPGGAAALVKAGWMEVGKQKSIWAEEISPAMQIDRNISPSFNSFVNSILALI